MKRTNVQLVMAVLLCAAGLILIFSGFWVAPTGEIHNSVLVAFGEISTFAGALFGVDYSEKNENEILSICNRGTFDVGANEVEKKSSGLDQ